jgi:hypothetical protein
MVLAHHRDAPAPAGIHGLGGGVGLRASGSRHGGNDGAIAEQARRPAVEHRAERAPDQHRAEAGGIDEEVVRQAAPVGSAQGRDLVAVALDLGDGRLDVGNPRLACQPGQVRDERLVVEVVGEFQVRHQRLERAVGPPYQGALVTPHQHGGEGLRLEVAVVDERFEGPDRSCEPVLAGLAGVASGLVTEGVGEAAGIRTPQEADAQLEGRAHGAEQLDDVEPQLAVKEDGHDRGRGLADADDRHGARLDDRDVDLGEAALEGERREVARGAGPQNANRSR